MGPNATTGEACSEMETFALIRARVCHDCGEKLMFTWTPKVCNILALRAILRGLGRLFYILLGFRYCSIQQLAGQKHLPDTSYPGFRSGILTVLSAPDPSPMGPVLGLMG